MLSAVCFCLSLSSPPRTTSRSLPLCLCLPLSLSLCLRLCMSSVARSGCTHVAVGRGKAGKRRWGPAVRSSRSGGMEDWRVHQSIGAVSRDLVKMAAMGPSQPNGASSTLFVHAARTRPWNRSVAVAFRVRRPGRGFGRPVATGSPPAGQCTPPSVCTTHRGPGGRRAAEGGRSEGEAPWRTAPRATPSTALLRPAACLAPAPFGVLLVGLRPVRAALPRGLLQGQHVRAEWSASDQAGARPAVGGAS